MGMFNFIETTLIKTSMKVIKKNASCTKVSFLTDTYTKVIMSDNINKSTKFLIIRTFLEINVLRC